MLKQCVPIRIIRVIRSQSKSPLQIVDLQGAHVVCGVAGKGIFYIVHYQIFMLYNFWLVLHWYYSSISR